ncbi:hypothetical protein BGZ73_006316 [Actinomortierella ambigua]|nr:hypothetical protein BGZ73_006316 [Actinomortierella ambigua]
MKFHQHIVAGMGLSLLLALSASAQLSSSSPNPRPATTTQPPATSTPVITPPRTTTTQVIRPPVTPTPGPVKPTTPQPPPPASTVPGKVPQAGDPCFYTTDCITTQLCAWSNNRGICQDIPETICPSEPRKMCSSHADCDGVSFSYCLRDNGGQMICAGLGATGNTTECLTRISKPKDENGGTSNVLMYAGIGVGSVAALAILFALVRWQRRRKRSRMPASMFGDVDYGMSNRVSAPRPSTGNANSGGNAGSADKEYPFTGRPNAQGSTGNNNNYDDQYYDDGYAQNMHPMAGMAGGKVGDAGYYDQQGYDNNHYDPNYDQGYYNQGYDQGYNNAGGYNNNGGDGYNQGAGYNNNAGGFYDDTYNTAGNQAGYNQYDAKTGGPTSPIAAVPPAHQRQGYDQGAYGANGGDQYGVEPSELDFGGHNKGSHNPQYGGGQGYGHF